MLAPTRNTPTAPGRLGDTTPYHHTAGLPGRLQAAGLDGSLRSRPSNAIFQGARGLTGLKTDGLASC